MASRLAEIGHDGAAVGGGDLGADPLAPGVVHADHGGVALALVQQDPALGGDIAVHAAVAVQMVGRDVEQDGDVGLRGWRSGRAGRTTAPAHRPRRRACRRRASTPMPMLPPMRTSRPAPAQMWPIRAVVVDLPLVPVMATTLGRLCSGAAFTVRANSSMSPTIAHARPRGPARRSSAAWDGSAARPATASGRRSRDQSARGQVARASKPSASAGVAARPACRPTAPTLAPPAMQRARGGQPRPGQAEDGDASCPRSRGPGS